MVGPGIPREAERGDQPVRRFGGAGESAGKDLRVGNEEARLSCRGATRVAQEWKGLLGHSGAVLLRGSDTVSQASQIEDAGAYALFAAAALSHRA